MAATSVRLCGSTELFIERQSIAWDIRGASILFQKKLLPIWKIKSPPFTANPAQQTWSLHLELIQSKNEFVKCILVQDGATNHTEETSYPVTSKVSEVLQTAANAEVISGAIINDVFIQTRDGHLESFSEIITKYEETNGWREWAGKFVEKRRKAGITEYIFGNDSDAYENAFPLTYISDCHERFVDTDDILHLQVEIIFTKTAEVAPTPENPEVTSPTADQRILSNEQLAQRLAEYYVSKSYSDATLLAGDQAFQVHKIILEARAPKLAACFFEKSRLADRSCCSEEPSHNENTDAAAGDIKIIRPKPDPEVIVIDNMSPSVVQAILLFIYSGTVSFSDMFTLTSICRESRKFDFHELTYACILQTLELFKNASVEQRTAVGDALKEMFSNCVEAVFENRALKMDELHRLYPLAFQQMNSGASLQ